MTKIQINGREYSIAYNMKVAIAYERITGKNPFELSQFSNGSIEPLVLLGYAMLISLNKEVPEYTEILESMESAEGIKDYVSAVSRELSAFFKVEEGDKKDIKAEGEDNPKNA